MYNRQSCSCDNSAYPPTPLTPHQRGPPNTPFFVSEHTHGCRFQLVAKGSSVCIKRGSSTNNAAAVQAHTHHLYQEHLVRLQPTQTKRVRTETSASLKTKLVQRHCHTGNRQHAPVAPAGPGEPVVCGDKTCKHRTKNTGRTHEHNTNQIKYSRPNENEIRQRPQLITRALCNRYIRLGACNRSQFIKRQR